MMMMMQRTKEDESVDLKWICQIFLRGKSTEFVLPETFFMTTQMKT